MWSIKWWSWWLWTKIHENESQNSSQQRHDSRKMKINSRQADYLLRRIEIFKIFPTSTTITVCHNSDVSFAINYTEPLTKLLQFALFCQSLSHEMYRNLFDDNFWFGGLLGMKCAQWYFPSSCHYVILDFVKILKRWRDMLDFGKG